MTLDDLIGEHEGILRAGWNESAGPSAGDDFASFVAGLRATLRTGAPPREPEAISEDAPLPELDALAATKAFGLLQRRILEIAGERSVALSSSEQLALTCQVNAAITRAAAGQTRRHGAELHRMAHQLRNPLGSALMALTLLRSRADLGEHVRLAEMLERNLKRVQTLIDEAVDEGAPSPAE